MILELSSRSALQAIFSSIFFESVLATQSCYWPNGQSPTADESFQVPCDASDDVVVTCCGDGHACLANGLCFGGDIGLVSQVLSTTIS